VIQMVLRAQQDSAHIYPVSLGNGAQEIAKHPDRMREAKRAGIGGQVKRLVRQAERERGRKKGKALDHDEGLERDEDQLLSL
jgi:hypothetical protein